MARHRRTGRAGIMAAVVGVVVAAATLVVASPSQAAFPGVNGLIAYVGAGDNVFVVNPSNPTPTQVTNTGTYHALNYNAAGNKIVAESDAGLALLDPVAGSGVTVVPNTTSGDGVPAFDPTGTKLAFQNSGAIFTIDVAGTNRTQIRDQGARPNWSADGTFIAIDNNAGTRIQRINPSGGGLVTLASSGPAGACNAAQPCLHPTVSPDNSEVAYTQRNVATAGIGEVNSDGSTATPRRLTTFGAAGQQGDQSPSYSPDGLRIVFARGAPGNGTLTTAPTDGSGTATAVGTINSVVDTSWGTQAGTGTGTGTGTGGSVISVTAARNGANCVFSIAATPAAAGITVDFSITNPKGVEKLAGNDVSVPASPSVKAKKRGRNKVRIITLSDPKGATLGTSTATCAK